MDLLPTSVEGAIATFCGIVAGAVVGVARISAAVENWKRRKAARSVPPTRLHEHFEARLGTLERTLAAQLEWDAAELRRELAEALQQLVSLRADLAQAHQAISQERALRQRAERERDAAVRTAQALRARQGQP